MVDCVCGSLPLLHATLVAFAGALRHRTQVVCNLKMHLLEMA